MRSNTVGGSVVGVADLGANGDGPWGFHPAIDASAHWIWSNPACGRCSEYISTPIIADALTAPEPSTSALLGTGLVALGGVARRRRSA